MITVIVSVNVAASSVSVNVDSVNAYPELPPFRSRTPYKKLQKRMSHMNHSRVMETMRHL